MPSDDFFSKLTFLKNSFRNTIRVSNALRSNGLDTVQNGHSEGPDLGLNGLQRL